MEIPINSWYHDELFPPDQPVGHEDMLFAPQVPQKVVEEEKTPEQLRHEGFHTAAGSGRDNFAGDGMHGHPGRERMSMGESVGGRYSLAMDDVCKYENLIFPEGHPKAGQQGPRVHRVVGKHCPHGMLETLEMQRKEEL
jgi:hypothetical protein